MLNLRCLECLQHWLNDCSHLLFPILLPTHGAGRGPLRNSNDLSSHDGLSADGCVSEIPKAILDNMTAILDNLNAILDNLNAILDNLYAILDNLYAILDNLNAILDTTCATLNFMNADFGQFRGEP